MKNNFSSFTSLNLVLRVSLCCQRDEVVCELRSQDFSSSIVVLNFSGENLWA